MSIYLQHPDKYGFLIPALVLGGEEKLIPMGWNHGLVESSGGTPTSFATARISEQKGLGIQIPSLPPLTACLDAEPGAHRNTSQLLPTYSSVTKEII